MAPARVYVLAKYALHEQGTPLCDICGVFTHRPLAIESLKNLRSLDQRGRERYLLYAIDSNVPWDSLEDGDIVEVE